MSFDALDVMRRDGWMVAIHNDYTLTGERYSFWLLTHPSGVWAKGEGRTDEEALEQAHAQALERRPARPESPLPTDRIATLEEVEHAHIAEVMRYFGENKAKAATALGICERTLYRKWQAIEEAKIARDVQAAREA